MKGVTLFSGTFAAFMATLCLLATASSAYNLTDDRISIDIHPQLGRGYAIEADKFLSTCLVVNETTTTLTRNETYNYTFTDLTASEDVADDVDEKLSFSLGHSGIKAELEKAQFHQSTSKVRTQPYYMVSTVRIEREYSISSEQIPDLSDDALSLLVDKKDYIGFFMVCGPNYVQSIRYAQEVTALFKFTSTSTKMAQQFAFELSVRTIGAKVESSFSSESKFSTIEDSLEIKIMGFGLELNEEGSESIVVTSLEEYNESIEYALNSFTKEEGSRTEIGKVYGVEVSSWFENEAFHQSAFNFINNIHVPLPLDSIPKAFDGAIEASPTTFNSGTRDNFSCLELTHQIDRYGFCCDDDELYDRTKKVYNSTTPSERICRPLESLDPVLVKDNLVENSEFVAQLDLAMQYRLNQIASLQNCIFSARSFTDEHYDNYILKPQNNGVEQNNFTLAELKLALDPFGDFGLVQHLGKELDEYMDMFYHPCIAALRGSTINDWSDTDGSYFMAHSWNTHDECAHPTCLQNDMRWEREIGGCVPSLITGSSADYDEGDTKCTKNIESNDEICKYLTTELREYRDKISGCWDYNPDSLSPNYAMLHFCLSDFTSEKADAAREVELQDYKSFCTAIASS